MNEPDKKVHLTSLGCAKNQVDGEWMLGQLVDGGHAITLDPDEADVLVVNTCSFIGPAKEESIEAILDMARVKAEGEGRKLVVTGCLAERYGTELREEMPEVDAFVGTGDFLAIREVLRDAGLRTDGPPAAYVGAQHVLPPPEVRRVRTGPAHSAYLKVSEGCNHRCAFCIIPKIRGRHESRPIENLVREAEQLVAEGALELNLIAQDLTAFGRDLPERASLADLLKRLAEVDGVEWIRLLYCYPNYVTGDLLETIASTPQICSYVDMPLQHGSDRILRAMRRERSADSLRRLIAGIRRRIPDAVLRSSFIVGFPGETDEDFRALCDFVEEIEFDRVGVFRYSQEENTAAGTLGEQVSEGVKKRRWDHLMKLQREISARKNGSRVGQELDVLVDGETEGSKRWGRFHGQAPEIDGVVFFEGEAREGEMARVRVTEAEDYDLRGTEVLDTRATHP